ncbi:hypothetical protein ACFLZ1_01530 [Patescibacteria group bacterium]
MNSYLIVGSQYKYRREKIEKIVFKSGLKEQNWENNPDVLIIKPELSIGIGKIRKAQKFLLLKAYQAPAKVLIILNAQKLTIPAQNAFLKTLEEPPANSVIILSCSNEDQLLATVVSRCQIIKLAPKSDNTSDKNIVTFYSLYKKILKYGVGERLKFIEEYSKNREEALEFCRNMVLVLRSVLISDKKNQNRKKSKNKKDKNYQQLAAVIISFQKTILLLEKNVNVKMAMDNLLINIKQP